MGKAGRRMIEALVAGERDPEAMAEMALTRMRPKIGELREARVGRFNDHHAFMLSHASRPLDELSARSRLGSTRKSTGDRPFDEAATRLLTIPGIGERAAQVVVAEIGVDMRRFPTGKHLASWAGLCPGHHESAGKRRSG